MADLTDLTSGDTNVNSDENDFAIKDRPLEGAKSSVDTFSSASSGSALDSLFSRTPSGKTPAAEEENEEVLDGSETEDNEGEKKKETVAKKPAVTAKPITDTSKKTSDDAGAKKAAEEAAAKKTADETAAKKTVEEPKDKLAEIQLGAHAKPATVKAFTEVKTRARAEISRLEAEVADLRTKVPKDGQKLPEPIEKELTDLRNFRRAHDYQNDTEFKTQYVQPIETNTASIFKKLEGVGFTKEQIETVKEIGVGKLDWAPIYAKHPQLQRSVEALLIDNERISEKRDQALEEAKKSPQVYAEKQKKEEETRKATEEAAVKNTSDDMLKKTDWFKVTPVPADATAEQKAEIEARNAFHKEQEDRLKTLLADNSPEMRGVMIASTLFAYQLQRQANHYKALYEKTSESLNKIRKAGSTKGSRIATTETKEKPVNGGLLVRGESALDSLRSQQLNSE
jgi:hypothetical protein